MKKFILTLIVSAIFLNIAEARVIEVFSNVEYVRSYDGDTITVNIPNQPNVFGKNIGIRVRGVDTPEIRGKCDNEKYIAIRARNYVRSLLENAVKIDLINPQRDKYFRIVADVKFDGADLREALLLMGFAINYNGGTKINVWCDN